MKNCRPGWWCCQGFEGSPDEGLLLERVVLLNVQVRTFYVLRSWVFETKIPQNTRTDPTRGRLDVRFQERTGWDEGRGRRGVLSLDVVLDVREKQKGSRKGMREIPIKEVNLRRCRLG